MWREIRAPDLLAARGDEEHIRGLDRIVLVLLLRALHRRRAVSAAAARDVRVFGVAGVVHHAGFGAADLAEHGHCCAGAGAA